MGLFSPVYCPPARILILKLQEAYLIGQLIFSLRAPIQSILTLQMGGPGQEPGQDGRARQAAGFPKLAHSEQNSRGGVRHSQRQNEQHTGAAALAFKPAWVLLVS